MDNSDTFIDINKIFVVDDVAPEWLYNLWVERIQQADRWKYGMAATRQDYGRFFVMWIANVGSHRGPRGPIAGDYKGIADTFNELWQREHLPKLMPDATVLNIHRSHLNGQFPTDNKLAIHFDFDMLDMWTMVYYLDGEDGNTIFYDNPKIDENGDMQPPEPIHTVEFKRNRAVFFPSFYWHAAENPSQDFRISLAFSYLLNECEINKKLRKDRGIEHEDLGHPDLSDFLQEIQEKEKYEKMHLKMQEDLEPNAKKS